jgi:hypothetical protein
MRYFCYGMILLQLIRMITQKNTFMKKSLAFILCLCITHLCLGQDTIAKTAKHRHTNTKAAKSKGGIVVPPWAEAHHYDATTHVYFPDYYTYYDPQRGGYVYWENGKYVFTAAVPPYLQNVDLRKSRIQLLKGLSLDMHPELDYPYYMKLYPADGTNNNGMVPVPTTDNPAQR